MANKDNADLAALQEQNEALRADLAALQEQMKQLIGNKPPTKAKLREQKQAATEAKLAAMSKRNEQAADLVTIQKFNRDGDVSRERVCARVDVAEFEKQGYKVKKA